MMLFEGWLRGDSGDASRRAAGYARWLWQESDRVMCRLDVPVESDVFMSSRGGWYANRELDMW